MKRNFVERQLSDFRHKRRQEELRFWNDLVETRRSLRDALDNYQDTLRQLHLVEEPR
jgi:hypothetical protein